MDGMNWCLVGELKLIGHATDSVCGNCDYDSVCLARPREMANKFFDINIKLIQQWRNGGGNLQVYTYQTI